MKKWILSLGFYQGVLFGVRTYESDYSTQYVLYIPFVDLCVEFIHEEEEEEE